MYYKIIFHILPGSGFAEFTKQTDNTKIIALMTLIRDIINQKKGTNRRVTETFVISTAVNFQLILCATHFYIFT